MGILGDSFKNSLSLKNSDFRRQLRDSYYRNLSLKIFETDVPSKIFEMHPITEGCFLKSVLKK